MTPPLHPMRVPALRLVALAAAMGLFTTALAADSRLEFKASEGTAATIETMLIGHGKVRIDRGKSKSVIIDPKAKVMTGLDHEKKEFMRFGDRALDLQGSQAREWSRHLGHLPALI